MTDSLGIQMTVGTSILAVVTDNRSRHGSVSSNERHYIDFGITDTTVLIGYALITPLTFL